jgi:ubiquinone/menaquinone biosynthesis C-methylase UbiE/DNA-binding transcriptional ArsR family regulator
MSTLGSTANLLALLAEPSRVRLLALLADQELTVADLTSVTELGQSRVSTHLGRLREAGLVRDHRVGGSTFYRLANGEMPAEARKLWTLVAEGLDDAQLEADRQRCAALLRARRVAPKWPESVAGEMERHYSPGRTWEALAGGIIGLLELGDVLDAGAGDGAIAQLLAPRTRSITCVDVSEKLVDAARVRLADFSNAKSEVADLHDLPFDAASFDQVLLLNVLPFLRTPGRALGEAARVLRPGGKLALVTLAEHEHLDVTGAYGHRHAGFAPASVRRMLQKAGLTVDTCGVTSRERRAPYFQVVTATARKEHARKEHHQ